MDVLQLVGHGPFRDAHREALHEGSLADSGLANDDRVVLPATSEDIHHLADFRFATEHRVELAVPCPLRQVRREAGQGAVRLTELGGGPLRRAASIARRGRGGTSGLRGRAGLRHVLRCLAARGRDRREVLPQLLPRQTLEER